MIISCNGSADAADRYLKAQTAASLPYAIVDTGQTSCHDDLVEIACGERWAGQDAQHDGHRPSYADHGDGTVTDLVTGLMWQKTVGSKATWYDAVDGARAVRIAGYDDWRLPTIKELYALIDFSGSSFVTASTSVPYIDTEYFDFEYGDTSSGERFIDAQFWSSTRYVGTTMNGDATAFGVNFADGRIKGYPTDTGTGGAPFTAFVRYVRGGSGYGENDYVDNGDGTVTDGATGLMWTRADSGIPMDWREALEYAESFEWGGYDDWRLPNAKELQSIVDYSRAPDATDAGSRGAAIDQIFDLTEEESWFWSSTTHLDGPDARWAVYVTFGRATGWMEQPPGSGRYVLLDVHGAGSQRSDPKTGDPTDYPNGHGPQGDVVRVENFVRLVRDAWENEDDSRRRTVRRR